MFNKNRFPTPSTFDTIIGSGVTSDGNLIADGNVKIDGKIKGNVKINGNLIMGETALIIGNVSASNLDTAGTIEGNVYCKGYLKLASTSKLIGDIQVKGVSMEEGAHFQGVCSMSNLEKFNSNSDQAILKSHDSNGLKKKPIINHPETNE